MAGQIIKRGKDTWLVRIFQGRDENGRRQYLNKTVRGTKKDADRYLTGKLHDKDLGLTSSLRPFLWTGTSRSGLRTLPGHE